MEQLRTRWLVLVFATFMPIAHVIMGAANSEVPTSLWQYYLAMVICLVLVGLLCWDSGKNAMPLWGAWSVVVGVLLMDLLVNSVLPEGIHPGYASWQNGAIQMLLVALTFRDRMRLAWLGMGLFAVADLSASFALGLSVTDALALVLTPIMWMVIATAVRSVLGRSRNNIAVYSAQSQLAATKLAKEHAHGLYRKQWLLELEQATRPALEAIAGQDLTVQDRKDLALLEAELRDQIRGRALVTPEIQHAARAARRRGVKVDLLDDRKTSLPDTVAANVFRQLLGILGAAQSGTLRARALPVGESPTVTILAFDDSEDENETYVEISEPYPASVT
ncbi:hypothetical protein [Arthrobacter sp. BF1]|uniref:hypothetical protein n=1 Tax=Arthrobacter sp. BF1 TaxID=2821145 RepID=UPI001C4F6E05|nr:hypothetical protein [Arthrobacter sp. BF1]